MQADACRQTEYVVSRVPVTKRRPCRPVQWGDVGGRQWSKARIWTDGGKSQSPFWWLLQRAASLVLEFSPAQAKALGGNRFVIVCCLVSLTGRTARRGRCGSAALDFDQPDARETLFPTVYFQCGTYYRRHISLRSSSSSTASPQNVACRHHDDDDDDDDDDDNALEQVQIVKGTSKDGRGDR